MCQVRRLNKEKEGENKLPKCTPIDTDEAYPVIQLQHVKCQQK